MKTIIITLLLLTGLLGNMNPIVTEATPCEVEPIELKPLSIEDSVRFVLNEMRLDTYVIELLVAQSKHESGNYKNNLTKKNNNIFARHFEKVDTFAIGAGGTAEGHSRFARYKSIKYATMSQYYYLLRKKYTFMWCDTKSFAVELKQRHYYEDSIVNYSKSLKRYIGS
jgi:hypothetical protein